MRAQDLVNKAIDAFKIKNYSIIQGQLNTPSADFNARAVGPLAVDLKNLNSKTEKLIRLHQFCKNERGNVLNLLKEVAKDKVAAFTEDQKEKARRDKKAYERVLNNMGIFQAWVESIVPQTSLQNQPSLISRDPNSLAMTYDESSRHDNTAEKDKQYVLDGQGLPLPPRLLREKLDPKHRAWGTMFRGVAHTLRPLNDNWVENRAEDLTVELEFNEELRAIDRSFNPENYQPTEDPEAKANYNSFNAYFTPKEALHYLLTVNKYKLVYHDNRMASDGSYIFVMDMQGNFFISKDGQYVGGKRIGHPSFTAGEPVACAGEITIKDGNITEINNSSGHYKPTGYSFHRVINALYSRGILAHDCRIRDFSETRFELQRDNGAPITQLCFDQFNEVFYKKVRRMQVPKLDLSEKANPLPVLDILKRINEYITARSKKTNRFLSIFGYYSGVDYYERRSSFQTLIKTMLCDGMGVQNFCQFLLQQQNNFSHGSSRTFAGLLSILRVHFEATPKSDTLFSHPVLREKLQELDSLYAKMDAVTQSLKTLNAEKVGLFGERQLETIQAPKERKVEYKYAREESSAKDEFLDAKELLEVERRNLQA